MRKTLIAVSIFIMLTSCDHFSALVNQKNNELVTEVAGFYTGMLPCADCRGIETSLLIKSNGYYEYAETYLGNESASYSISGVVDVDPVNRTVNIQNGEETVIFRIEKNNLLRLNADGQRISGRLAEHYKLKKQ